MSRDPLHIQRWIQHPFFGLLIILLFFGYIFLVAECSMRVFGWLGFKHDRGPGLAFTIPAAIAIPVLIKRALQRRRLKRFPLHCLSDLRL